MEFWTPERRATAVPRDLVLMPNGKPSKPGGGTGPITGATWTGGGSVSAPRPTLGEWTATDLFTTAGWATGSTSFDDDAGFALVVGAEDQGTLASVLEAGGGKVPGIAFETTTSTYYAFGYPASKKYRGDTLTYCAGPVTPRYDGHETLALACDMTGGSSGGPWFQSFPNDTTTPNVINSLNSYGYMTVRNTMFGPIFGTAESDTYTAASELGDCLLPLGLGYHCVSHS